MSAFSTYFSPPTCTHAPAPVPITEAQQEHLKALEVHFGAAKYDLPVKELAQGRTELTQREMMFLSRETFVRFLTATKGDLSATITRLEDCLVWRRTEQIDDFDHLADTCEEEARTGKNFVLGYSNKRQPIIYFFPNRNTTPLENRRPIHAVFMLERASDLMCDGVTNVVVIFNFAGKREGPPTSISAARQTLHILSHYYPERLGLCVFQNMPWIVKTFVSLMWPFVDPNTKKKVLFGSAEGGEIMKNGAVNAGQLMKEGGGTLDMPYNHDVYWPALLDTCKKLRSEEEERWRGLGEPKVGREERSFKRSSHTSDDPSDP
ncbi:hypothetical protein IAR55_001179 [Kwoniella newhampshirensis]|uniref:CRAL-TRIO domain-containing protein n=1 Tax=Kwoniella newhampshirensis TaxID=1651941 RepID=A0AAW0Z582_9TREE